MTNTTNTSKNTTAAFEDQAVKGKASSAEAIFGNVAKPMFGRGKINSPLKIALTTLLLLAVFLLPIYLQAAGGNPLGSPLLSAAIFIGLFAILGLGLNIIIGYAGMLDFGRMAFYAVGAYAAMLLVPPLAELLGGTIFSQLAFPILVIASGVAASFAGWLLSLPVMRLRGDYLAIVTLAFGEIVRLVLTNNPGGLTGGMSGLSRAHMIELPFFNWLRETVYWAPSNDFILRVSTNLYWYYVVLILLILVIIVVRRQDHSRLGRSWAAMREDEVAATAMGVNVTRAKTWAFVLGAFWGGAAGACFGFYMGTVTPESFNFFNSVVVLAIVVVGGMGSIPGVLLGSVLITGAPELIRWFAMNHLGQAGSEFQSLVANLRNLMLGLLMVLMMIFRTKGLIPMKPKHYKLYGKNRSDKGDSVGSATDTVADAAPKGGASS